MFGCPLPETNKAGQEQFSRPAVSWGSVVLPVQVWLLALTQRWALAVAQME